MVGPVQAADIAQGGHLEDVRLAEVDLTAEGGHGAVRGEDGRALGEAEAVLDDAREVGPRAVGLADGPAGQVHDVVAVGNDVAVQLCDAGVGPVPPDHVHDVAQSVGFGDGPVDVRDHHGGLVLPQIHVSLARRPVDGEAHRVLARPQVQGLELLARQPERLGVVPVGVAGSRCTRRAGRSLQGHLPKV